MCVFRFTSHPHLHLTRRQRQVLVMSPQHPLVWCPPPLRPKATTICRLPQRSTVPTTTAVYRPISVNGMFKTVPSLEEPFQKTRRSIYSLYKTNAPIIRACPAGFNIPTTTEETCAKALNIIFFCTYYPLSFPMVVIDFVGFLVYRCSFNGSYFSNWTF